MNKINENQVINKLVLTGWSIVIFVLMAAYALEVIKGERTIAYYLTIAVLSILPLLLGFISYFKNKENHVLRYISAYGYSMFYIFLLMTGDTVIVFVYIFPLLSLLLAYNDYKLLRNFSILNITANLVSAFYSLVILRQTSPDSIADREIQVAAAILILVLAYFSSKKSTQLNEAKINFITNSEKIQTETLSRVMHMSSSVRENVNQIYKEAGFLTDSSQQTANAIAEIAMGSSHTTLSILEQLKKSEDIRQLIQHETELSHSINQQMNEAKENVDEGRNNMDQLRDSAEATIHNTKQSKDIMHSLSAKAKEVKSIISIIDNIAYQTNMLALNASIESARAGTAGKAFAVVAQQITGLAGQTKDATSSISSIVGALQMDAQNAAAAVESMAEANSLQNELINHAGSNFNDIFASIKQAVADVNKQTEEIIQIKEANERIESSIQNISDNNQSVSGFSNETKKMSAENLQATERVKALLAKVIEELSAFE